MPMQRFRAEGSWLRTSASAVGPWRRWRAIACVALLLVTAGRARADELVDRVLAVAAGDLIMLSDVRAALVLGMASGDGAPDPVRAVLSTLIDRALMLDEVNRYALPQPSGSEIDRALSEVRARFGSTDAFDQALQQVGLDEGRLRETLLQNLRLRAYLAQRFASDTPVRVRAAVDEWMTGLRRRADIVDRYDAIAR